MKRYSISQLVQIKSVLRITRSQTFLDLIFLMHVSLENKKDIGKQAKA